MQIPYYTMQIDISCLLYLRASHIILGIVEEMHDATQTQLFDDRKSLKLLTKGEVKTQSSGGFSGFLQIQGMVCFVCGAFMVMNLGCKLGRYKYTLWVIKE